VAVQGQDADAEDEDHPDESHGRREQSGWTPPPRVELRCRGSRWRTAQEGSSAGMGMRAPSMSSPPPIRGGGTMLPLQEMGWFDLSVRLRQRDEVVASPSWEKLGRSKRMIFFLQEKNKMVVVGRTVRHHL
jgi:hypothetical protein